MELDQLSYFVAVIEEGGLRQASRRLGAKESTINSGLHQLERELGSPLVQRGYQDPNLTAAGRVLFRHAREVLKTTRVAQHAVRDLNGDLITGEIRIGAMDCVCLHFLPRMLQGLQERHPKIQPSIICHNSGATIVESLLSDRLDIALVDHPRFDRRLHCETVFEERVSLVCGRSHPFWSRDKVKPSELKKHPFIELCPDCTIGQIVRNYLSRLGVGVNMVASTDNPETAKKMVEIGYGLAFLPDMVTRLEVPCHGEPSGDLARVMVEPACTRRIDLVTRKSAKPSRAAAAFLGELRQRGSQWDGCLKAG